MECLKLRLQNGPPFDFQWVTQAELGLRAELRQLRDSGTRLRSESHAAQQFEMVRQATAQTKKENTELKAMVETLRGLLEISKGRTCL